LAYWSTTTVIACLLLCVVLLLASAAERPEKPDWLRITVSSIPTPERPVPPPAAHFFAAPSSVDSASPRESKLPGFRMAWFIRAAPARSRSEP